MSCLKKSEDDEDSLIVGRGERAFTTTLITYGNVLGIVEIAVTPHRSRSSGWAFPTSSGRSSDDDDGVPGRARALAV